MLERELEIAIRAALEAGKKIMQIYENENFDVAFKADASPLTKADLASHNVIMEYLADTDIPVLSEEGSHLDFTIRKGWKKLWIVDPLDGTKEFIKRNGEFTVNIALVEDQQPILGVIYVPVLKQLYFGTKENGSNKIEGIEEFKSLEDTFQKSKKLPLSNKRNYYTVVASKSHLSPETEEYIKNLEVEKGKVETISKGSSLKLCMVAEGRADCYPRFAPTMEWDTAAGHAICSFAGKNLQDYTTKAEMKYNRENLLNNWFLIQ